MENFAPKNVATPRSQYAKQLMCRPGLRKARVRCSEETRGERRCEGRQGRHLPSEDAAAEGWRVIEQPRVVHEFWH